MALARTKPHQFRTITPHDHPPRSPALKAPGRGRVQRLGPPTHPQLVPFRTPSRPDYSPESASNPMPYSNNPHPSDPPVRIPIPPPSAHPNRLHSPLSPMVPIVTSTTNASMSLARRQGGRFAGRASCRGGFGLLGSLNGCFENFRLQLLQFFWKQPQLCLP